MNESFCVANGCGERFFKGATLKFHRFPLDNPPLLQKWYDAIKRENFKASKSIGICERHFKASDFDLAPHWPFQRKLKKDAVPSKFVFDALSRKHKTKLSYLTEPESKRKVKAVPSTSCNSAESPISSSSTVTSQSELFTGSNCAPGFMPSIMDTCDSNMPSVEEQHAEDELDIKPDIKELETVTLGSILSEQASQSRSAEIACVNGTMIKDNADDNETSFRTNTPQSGDATANVGENSVTDFVEQSELKRRAVLIPKLVSKLAKREAKLKELFLDNGLYQKHLEKETKEKEFYKSEMEEQMKDAQFYKAKLEALKIGTPFSIERLGEHANEFEFYRVKLEEQNNELQSYKTDLQKHKKEIQFYKDEQEELTKDSEFYKEKLEELKSKTPFSTETLEEQIKSFQFYKTKLGEQKQEIQLYKTQSEATDKVLLDQQNVNRTQVSIIDYMKKLLEDNDIKYNFDQFQK